MIKAFMRPITFAAVLAIASLAAGAAEAKNFSFKFMSSGAMQSMCNLNNGYFSSASDGSSYFCVEPNGNNFICAKKARICAGTIYSSVGPDRGPKFPGGVLQQGQSFTLSRRMALQWCAPPTVDTPNGCGIPCDPVYLCKIFCGGKTYCDVTLAPRHAKLDPQPQNLAPTSGGGNAPAIVP
jgi:hypothetical protein